jgi:hypothetical protein
MIKPLAVFSFVFGSCILPSLAESGDGWVSFPGGKGPGSGKHVVLLAGDEEYRSEESMPMLAKILSERHGFKTTVLFSIDGEGFIAPGAGESLGKPDTLDSADALILGLRFRKYPNEVMKKFDDAVQRGVPLIATRTSTHAFNLPKESEYYRYSWNNQGGFGKSVLGETWVNHWGKHKAEATLAVIEPGAEKNPLLNGVKDIFGDTDVYEVHPPADATILLRGQVLKTMEKDSGPADYQKTTAGKVEQPVNDPMMPVAWTREVKNASGKTNKVLTTTMASATDLTNEDLRRLLVNGVYWGLGLKVPAKADVTIVGEFVPSKYDFNGFKKGVKAQDFDLK